MIFNDVLEIKNGRNQKLVENSNGKYPIYGSGGIMGYADDYICEADTVIIGRKGSINNPIYVDEPFWNVDTAFGLCAKKDILIPRYLYYFCRHFNFERLNKAVTIPSLTKSDLLKIEIKIPKIDEQRNVVDRLLKVEQIIRMRKKELCELNELIKARFVEMFGDPIQNSKGWEMSLIEDVVAKEKNALKAGPFGSALKKEYYVESGYKIYGQEQVISGDHTLGDYYIDEARYKMLENCAVQAGDVLISLVGTYGKLLIMPENFEPGIINPRLMKITFDKEKVNPYYFKYFFQSEALKRALSENTHGGTMDILNLGIVRKIEIPLPPLDLQNKFVSFVNQVNKSKFVERFPELSLFYRLSSPLDSEMICIFPYFCPCEESAREIREILCQSMQGKLPVASSLYLSIARYFIKKSCGIPFSFSC